MCHSLFTLMLSTQTKNIYNYLYIWLIFPTFGLGQIRCLHCVLELFNLPSPLATPGLSKKKVE